MLMKGKTKKENTHNEFLVVERWHETSRVQYAETLDPVGKEDADVDNDGKKNDSNDKYIMKRRAAIRKDDSKKKSLKD